MTNVMTVDLEKLKAISTENQSSKSVFKYLFDRRRGRQDTNIKRVQRILKESGADVNASDISEVFKKLQDLGIGKIVFGRRGNPNRFLWTANLRSIKDILEGKSQALYKQSPTVKKLNQPKLVAPATSVPRQHYGPVEPLHSSAAHMLTVRKGSIEIQVPAALTEEEAKGVAALLAAAS